MYVCQLNVSKHRLQLLGSVVAFQTMHKLCYGLFIQHKLSNGDIKRELFLVSFSRTTIKLPIHSKFSEVLGDKH